MRSICSPLKNNVLLVLGLKNCYFPCKRRFDQTSSVFISFKCNKGRKGRNGFLKSSLLGAFYNSKRHKAIVAQDRITRKTCKLLVCPRYVHCPRSVSPRVPKPEGRVSCGNPSLCRQWWHDRNPCQVSPDATRVRSSN